MNQAQAKQIVETSLSNLYRKSQSSNPLKLSDVSADIIANGALAILRCRDQRITLKNLSDDNDGIDPRETLMSNLTTWMRAKDSIKEDEEYKTIAFSFRIAAEFVIQGLSEDDADYIEEEIFKLASDGNANEIVGNWFIEKHNFSPFLTDNDKFDWRET